MNSTDYRGTAIMIVEIITTVVNLSIMGRMSKIAVGVIKCSVCRDSTKAFYMFCE